MQSYIPLVPMLTEFTHEKTAAKPSADLRPLLERIKDAEQVLQLLRKNCSQTNGLANTLVESNCAIPFKDVTGSK